MMMDRIRDKGEKLMKSQSRNLASSSVAVAIKGNKKSKQVVQWALDKFVPEGRIMFKLIHVHAGINGEPLQVVYMQIVYIILYRV